MEALEIQARAKDPQRGSTFVFVVEHDVLVGDVLAEVLMVERPRWLPEICNLT